MLICLLGCFAIREFPRGILGRADLAVQVRFRRRQGRVHVLQRNAIGDNKDVDITRGRIRALGDRSVQQGQLDVVRQRRKRLSKEKGIDLFLESTQRIFSALEK